MCYFDKIVSIPTYNRNCLRCHHNDVIYYVISTFSVAAAMLWVYIIQILTATLKKIMPRSYAILPEAKRNVDRSYQSIFVFVCHEINTTHRCRNPWRSSIEYVMICIILWSDQKSTQMHGVTGEHHVPRDHGSYDVMFPRNMMASCDSCSRGTWCKPWDTMHLSRFFSITAVLGRSIRILCCCVMGDAMFPGNMMLHWQNRAKRLEFCHGWLKLHFELNEEEYIVNSDRQISNLISLYVKSHIKSQIISSNHKSFLPKSKSNKITTLVKYEIQKF